MTTISSSFIKLSGSIIVTVSLAFGLSAQSATKSSLANTASESEKLMQEADRMQVQADLLRQNAMNCSGEAKRMMNVEAGAIEKIANEKRYKSLNLSFEEKLKVVIDNDQKIEKFRGMIVAQKHKSHTKFLVEDSRKNRRQAEELFQESRAGSNLSFQLGSIENALEKIQLALNQQLNIFLLLKEEEDAKVAARH